MKALSPVPGSFQIDATVGGGGHAVRILEAIAPDGRLLGLDADPEAIGRTAERLAPFGSRAVLRRANFEELAAVAAGEGFDPADGLLLDLGLSSYQLADPGRGFSFAADGPLDMRFDPTSGEPASALVDRLDAGQLARIFREYGEEPAAGRIARAIVAARAREPIVTARGLAAVVERAAPRPPAGRRPLHPATRVFQALRIVVNRELDVLQAVLVGAVSLLRRPGGRLVVLTYHSLEDRIVKRFLADERRGCTCPPRFPVCICGHEPRLRPVSSQPQAPTAEEIARNPRARSAHLRAAERLAA